MMEHSELVEDMKRVEKMPIPTRIKLAQKRRQQQLITHMKWAKSDNGDRQTGNKKLRCITFSPEVQLMDAAARGAYDEMAALLQKGVDPNLKNHDGLTALHQCCIDGSTEMVALLLKYNADINVTDRDLWTPLHAAATCGHFKIVTTLVRAGAQLIAVNGDGDMPHDITEDEVILQYLESETIKQGVDQEAIALIRSQHHDILLVDVSTILSSGGNVDQPLDQGGTFLHVAIANGFNDIVRLLLEAEANVTVADWDGWQPIHVAAYWGNDEALDLLADLPTVNLKATTKLGETPYELCEDADTKFKIMQLLSERATMPSFPDKEQEEEVKEEISIENQVNDAQDQDHETSDQTSEESRTDSPRPSIEDAPTSPLVNIIERLSERRNSIKEAKHNAPMKRMSIERNSSRVKRRSSDTEPLQISKTTKKETTEETLGDPPPYPDLPLNPANISSLSNIYETVPTLNNNKDVPPLNNNDTVPTLNTNENVSPLIENIYENLPTLNNNAQPEEPMTNLKEALEEDIMGDKKKEEGSATNNNAKDNKENKAMNELVVIRRKKKPAPPPPGSLLEIKLQRQSVRELSLDEETGQPKQRASQNNSIFYQSLPALDTRMYEAPPSPSAIRYRYKMVEEEDETRLRSFIKQKKCNIM